MNSGTTPAPVCGLPWSQWEMLCAMSIAGLPQSAAQLTADCARPNIGTTCDDLQALRLGGYVRNLEKGWVLTSAGHEILGETSQ
jgi:hypothetical protein